MTEQDKIKQELEKRNQQTKEKMQTINDIRANFKPTCCNKEMLQAEIEPGLVMGLEGLYWICPECFNLIQLTERQLDTDEAFNLLGLDPEDCIQNSATADNNTITSAFIKVFNEQNTHKEQAYILR